MKLFYTITVLGCIFLNASAQYDSEKINKKAIEAYNRAMLQLNDGLIKDAVPLLGKAIEYDPKYVDAYLSLAGVYGELKDYDKSIAYYEKARSLDTEYFKLYNLPYSINLAGKGLFNEALNATNTFLTIPKLNERSIESANFRKKTYSFALDYARTHKDTSYVFAPVNLGDSVNSSLSEYYPSFTIDDRILVFTRHSFASSREDFFQCIRKENDGYSKSALINGSINNEPFKGAINISQDGEWLLFAGNFKGQGYGNFDLFISYNTPTGWSEPENLGPNINTEFWESAPSLSPDKNTLFFSSSRPGGYGSKDLYVSYRQPNGKWSKAQNMGPDINTAGDEQAPFIHADGRSLYFTSNGLPGYGGTDIFLTRHNSNNEWSIPENLGYPINTIENEGTLSVASNGITAYYASDRSDTRGGLDLYKFDLRQDIRPIKTLYVKGTVFDIDTKKGLPCTVELFNNNDQKVETKLQTDETGFYFITLPVGKDYTFIVNRKGYLFYSDVYALSNKSADSTYSKDIALQPIKISVITTLKNIQFANKAYQLEDVSKIELDKLVALLNDNPTIKIQISGHTDNVGKPEDNIRLSGNRAKSVVDYLVSKGIDIKRLSWKGYGETKPASTNDTEEGRALNRRTEFVIIEL